MRARNKTKVMIIRNKRISTKRTEISFTISFGKADIKRFWKIFISDHMPGDNSCRIIDESSIIEICERDYRIFGTFGQKYADQLCDWFITQSLDYGFLKESDDCTFGRSFVITDKISE